MANIIENCSVSNDGFPGPAGVPGIYVGPVLPGVFPAMSFGSDADAQIKSCFVSGMGGDGVMIVDTGRSHTVDRLTSIDNAGHGLSVRTAPKRRPAAPQANRHDRRRAKAQARRKD